MPRNPTPATDDTTKPRERPRPQYVFVERPKCPSCGSVRLLAYATRKNGDGTLTRYVRCADCQTRVVVVVE